MSYVVTVNFEGGSFPVSYSPSWSVARLRNEIARLKNTQASRIKIIFAGQEIPDSYTLAHCNMNHSVIHAVPMKAGQLTVETVQVNDSGLPTLNNVVLASEDSELGGSASAGAGTNANFFVYCKSCQKLANGKLRCRCSECKQGSFVLTQGPNCWEDVLTKGKILGRCESPSNCQQTSAEFYFKCGEHQGSDEQAPLSMVKHNHRNVPCIICLEVPEKLLVFSCESKHTMCLDCFQRYCITLLNSRSFVQVDGKGYTMYCPGMSDSCRLAFIDEPHHFRMLGKEQYERYQRFATEECVLSSEGVLCPGRGCGQGIIPPPDVRRVTCEGGCGLVFCRRCLLEYHDGPCEQRGTATATATGRNEANRFEVSHESDQVSRWERETQKLIRKTTKRCPRSTCGVNTEKNAGCNHMTCTRCKLEWCWVCRVAWNRRCQSNHWFIS